MVPDYFCISGKFFCGVFVANKKTPRLARFVRSMFSHGGFVQLVVKRSYEWARTGRGGNDTLLFTE